MARVLVPIPASDFDPTETAVPWRILGEAGHRCVFATPEGAPGAADERMLRGTGLGVWKPLLMAAADARADYARMAQAGEFVKPLAWRDIDAREFDALLLPGGHAPGMRPYLESTLLQEATARFFAEGKPVAAICHGTLLAARSRGDDARSVLYGRKTTGLPRSMELLAWNLTRLYLGDYYRTYPLTVEEEVRTALRAPQDFDAGPPALRRDTAARPRIGFTVRDGNYLSARWPGDAHRFGLELTDMLNA